MSEPTMEAVLAFLNSLGTTDQEVYESLKAQQITGWRGGPDCPVEVALAKHFANDDVSFHVGNSTFWASSAQDPRALPYTELPAPVVDFIRKFDGQLAYQDLARRY